MIDPLSRLAITYGTDKFGHHNYTPKYHALLGHLQDAPLRMLEIGIGGYADPKAGGESLQVWRDYFPKAQIVGLDIAEKTLDLGDRVTIEQGSQVDADVLRHITEEHGPFDIILDDGSHQNAHVIASFEMLFDTLKPGGFYIVEDVQTAFFPRFGGGIAMDPPNMVAYFRQLMAALVQDDPSAAQIETLFRFHNIIGLQKKGPGILAPPDPDVTRETPDGFETAFAPLKDGGWLEVTIPEAVPAALLQWFVDVDHREIAVFHPEYESPRAAHRLYAMQARRGAVALQAGPNAYPSNFDFDANHREARAALAICKAVLTETPTERGLQVYAQIANRAGWTDEVHEVAERLAAVSPQEPRSFQLMSISAKKAGDTERLRTTLEAAHEAFPAHPGFAAELANAYAKWGEPEKAEAIARAARAKGAESAELSLRFAMVLLAKGALDEALSEARTAVSLKPKMTNGWIALVRILLARDEAAAAQDAGVEGLKKAGKSAGLLGMLAESRLALEDHAGAQDAIVRGLEIVPDNPRLLRLQARLAAAG